MKGVHAATLNRISRFCQLVNFMSNDVKCCGSPSLGEMPSDQSADGIEL